MCLYSFTMATELMPGWNEVATDSTDTVSYKNISQRGCHKGPAADCILIFFHIEVFVLICIQPTKKIILQNSLYFLKATPFTCILRHTVFPNGQTQVNSLMRWCHKVLANCMHVVPYVSIDFGFSHL